MKNLWRILLVMLICVDMVSAKGLPEVEELLNTDTSWDGGNIYYPTGEAEITAVKVKLHGGQTLPFHCHPVPVFGYVLKGAVKVETKDGRRIVLKKGEAVLEVMRIAHKGTAVGGPTEILVFYAGAETVPNTVFMDSEDAHKYCI